MPKSTSKASQNKKSKPVGLRVLIFGGTGMVGQGVLRECLLDPSISYVQTVGRQATGNGHPKLREIRHAELEDYSAIEDQLKDFDACFFCLGITSVGTTEETYRKVTYDITLAAAHTLVRLNPQMVFVYVTGAGTDSSASGRVMWARIKGKTENDLLSLPFRAAYMFRPGAIQPLHGIRSKTRIYQMIYSVTGAIFPLLRTVFPNTILTTEQIGRAMITAAHYGTGKKVLEIRDIVKLAELPPGKPKKESKVVTAKKAQSGPLKKSATRSKTTEKRKKTKK